MGAHHLAKTKTMVAIWPAPIETKPDPVKEDTEHT